VSKRFDKKFGYVCLYVCLLFVVFFFFLLKLCVWNSSSVYSRGTFLDLNYVHSFLLCHMCVVCLA
jgi:hypothetical protein